MTDAIGYTARRTERDRAPPSRILTGALMGDPLPDRFERSEAARARIPTRAAPVRVVPARVLGVMRALARGPLSSRDIADRIGISQSAAGDWIKASVATGAVRHTGPRMGREYFLTQSGREALEAQPQ